MAQIDLREVYYRVIVSPPNKAPIEITSLCESISHEESEDRFVSNLNIQMKNVKEREYGWMHSNIGVMTPIRLQAKEGKGGKWTTIFNGMIEKRKTNAEDHTIDVTAYDVLSPLMKSEEHYYFREDTTAKEAIETVAKDKGIKLKPISSKLNAKLPKKVATGKIHDTIKERIDSHNDKSPNKFLVRADLNGHMEVVQRGSNETIYEITDWSISDSSHEISIEDLVTVVKVYGKSENDERPPVKATHKRNTNLGEVTRIITDSGDEKSEADKEAKEILDEYSKPKQKVMINTPDIPWLRKGDKIRVATGTVGSYKNGQQVPVSCIVKSISRNVDSRMMSLELEV